MKFFIKYSFIIMLILTCLIALPIGLNRAFGVHKEHSGDKTCGEKSVPEAETGLSASSPISAQHGKSDNTMDAGNPEVLPAGGVSHSSPPEEAEIEASDCSQPEAQPGSGGAESEGSAEAAGSRAGEDDTAAPPSEVSQAFQEVPAEYFDDALFIGDSRTVGIMEYGGIANATFFAGTGMSVYNLFSEKVSVANIGLTDLSELLESQTYGKVYIMLGINELGYNYNQTVEKYKEVVTKIREFEPEALIFIEANLYVSKTKSEGDAIFNNQNISRFNSDISRLADGETVYYLDINPVFNDGSGNLAEEYTGDGVHIFAKYYKNWSDWFCTMGVVK
ncbi:MAG: GDSL-type esterase/lipase family protein [Oscillospiraceae bacterium]|jgi:hypothetical protein